MLLIAAAMIHPQGTAQAHHPLSHAVAEGVGTAFLLMAIVGSGIMGERLAGGNLALALLANALATGAALVALISAFAPLSGAHFNPLVTLSAAATGGFAWTAVPAYLIAQLIGALSGVALAHLMFGLPLYTTSHHMRCGSGQLVSEALATFGLLVVISATARQRPRAVPLAVAAYVTAAYWFTASTGLANPAVTVARSLTDTFAGIRPHDVPAFVVVQCLGAAAGAGLLHWLFSATPGPTAGADKPAAAGIGSLPPAGTSP